MFSGRLGRAGFLRGLAYILLPLLGVILLYGIVDGLTGAGGGIKSGSGSLRALGYGLQFLATVWILLFLPVWFSLSVRRWHDMGQTGWLVLLQMIPLVSFIVLLVLVFAPGTAGPNKYGDRGYRKKFKAVLFGSV